MLPKAQPAKTRSKPRVPKPDVKPHVSHAPSERPPSYDCYHAADERAMFAQQCTRQLSASPPPVFSYPPLSAYDAYRPGYGQLPIYHHVPTTYGELPFPEYQTVPSVVPMMPTPATGVSRKPTYDEDIISPFSMSYASMAGIDLCPQPSHPEPGLPVHFHQRTPRAAKANILQMPSLSYSYADDQRAPSTSPDASIFTFPLTPESPPCSPRSMPGMYEYDLRP